MISAGFNYAADAALIREAFTGRRESAKRLVARLMPILCATVRRSLRAEHCKGFRPEDAEDLIQEIWLHLVSDGGRRLRAYDPARGISIESYVAVIAERELVSGRRRTLAKKRGGHLVAVGIDGVDAAPLASPDVGPEENVATQELIVGLHEELERELPERGRLVWRYTFTDGRDPADVADLIGVQVQVVYNWQHKIRRLARAFFGRERDEQAVTTPQAAPALPRE